MPSSNPPPLDVARLGQVFTPDAIVRRMLALRRKAGRVLEPSCGDGAFARHLPGCTAIEVDARHCPPGALNQDFFAYPESEKFATIIGNPPYVRYQDIAETTRAWLPSEHFDGRSNLYLFFIEKCLRHLEPGGELIFITPRDFLKATSAVNLNRLLFEAGTITDFIELGDARIFDGATPNCAIWRFERGNFSRRTRYEAGSGVEDRHFLYAGGHLAFTHADYTVPLAELFSVKVGAVSGADAIFASDKHGTMDFVCSHTAKTGETKRMIFQTPHPALKRHKKALLARRIRRFDEQTWWQWGRLHPISERPRLYVNCKTRSAQPFFLHPCRNFDGAILALFPHDPAADLEKLCAMLNLVDWAELGFVCDGRYLFAQRSLQQALLPESFRSLAAV
ncbi:MAG TPA: class I SAM-dependent methyltransferase [Accumulibacter sp.]|nr:class I SAM-dependent methyltransferase [Accumulibacter sp.]